MNSFDKNCESYWSMSELLPLDVIVEYWCQNNKACMEAKRHALLSALKRGEVRFQRSDGKDFNDPIYSLYERGLILVNRESFLEWAGEISNESEKQNIQKSLELRPRAETTYLTIIGTLLAVIEDGIPDGKGAFSRDKIGPATGFCNESSLISAIAQYCEGISGMSARTLQGKFPEAKRVLKSKLLDVK